MAFLVSVHGAASIGGENLKSPAAKKKTHWIIVCINNCFFVCASNQRYMGCCGAPRGGAAKGSAQNESKVMGASSKRGSTVDVLM